MCSEFLSLSPPSLSLSLSILEDAATAFENLRFYFYSDMAHCVTEVTAFRCCKSSKSYKEESFSPTESLYQNFTVSS